MKPEQDNGPIAYLRDLDGTGSLHVCAKDDPGAISVYSADEIERLRNPWQPMNTVPKDGSIVDLFHRDGIRMTDCWWSGDDGWVGGAFALTDDDFIGWMPAPGPPKAPEGEQRA